MTAIKKEELERLEAEYGLSEDGLTYQHRCSRITAYMKGEGKSWQPPESSAPRAQESVTMTTPTHSAFESHPLYGKRILITPMMVPDAKRNLAYDEPLGPDITVRDFNAGEQIYGAAEDVQRMVGDYEIIAVDPSRQVMAKTTFPKIGTEISWCLGKELVPVVRGNDGKVGYLWSTPTRLIQVGDSIIQIYGLKTLIRATYPELEPKFSGKPMMDYVDGVTLVASIPQTHALLDKFMREQRMYEKTGLSGGFGL